MGRRVALRKESVDRNAGYRRSSPLTSVALRKESVDRNFTGTLDPQKYDRVALRKESVDRNLRGCSFRPSLQVSLSARRAWIEIRNGGILRPWACCRSPQGERG